MRPACKVSAVTASPLPRESSQATEQEGRKEAESTGQPGPGEGVGTLEKPRQRGFVYQRHREERVPEIPRVQAKSSSESQLRPGKNSPEK